MKTCKHRFHRASLDGAFTAIELLVVIAVLAVLATLLAPALANTKVQTQTFRCQNNLKQLTMAWAQFSAENNDALMDPTSWLTDPGPPSNPSQMDWSSGTNNIDTRPLLNGPIGPYVKSATYFKCPADKYQSAANPGLHVRSVSLNGNVGAATGNVQDQPPLHAWFGSGTGSAGASTKLTDLNKPGPASVIVILDEQADSIAALNGDANFAFDFWSQLGNEGWRDLPGSYHNGAGSFSFADGHTEIHQWQNPKFNPTVYSVKMITYGVNPPWKLISGKSLDYEWVRDRMAYR